MIVSASYRTDLPAFYGRWFLERLKAGYCRVVNPYGGPASRIDLSPDAVDGFVFWTRNIEPFLPVLAEVAGRGFPFVVQFTATGYPRALESSVIAPERAVAQLVTLRGRYGPTAAVWRYDPIVITDLTPIAWHRDRFRALSKHLHGVVDEVVVSFLEPYRKTARNLDAAARAAGFSWHRPELAERRELLADLAVIAAEHGQALTLCTQPDLTGVVGTSPARCIDAERLSAVAGRPITARVKGNRPGCECHQSRDLGAYDSCPHGCVYCYAVAGRAIARRRHQSHDPNGEFLIAPG